MMYTLQENGEVFIRTQYPISLVQKIVCERVMGGREAERDKERETYTKMMKEKRETIKVKHGGKIDRWS